MNPTLIYITQCIYPIAMQLLPEKMRHPDAWKLVTAIGFQESEFKNRRQVMGPAVSFWQFEEGGGIRGVLNHEETQDYARFVCSVLNYKPEQKIVYEAMVHNDVLAACFARLLLWTDPRAIPTNSVDGWLTYISTWRPGKPHPSKWATSFQVGQTKQEALRA